MFKKFLAHGRKNHFWSRDSRILLAISGGVDSMVLLNFMEQIAKQEQVTIGVAHVNHQLRPESINEAAYIKEYCRRKQLPYYEIKWTAQSKKSNIEARARAFRYEFFEEIMTKNNYDSLMTAHHSDDQAETVLMKLTRGSALLNLVGIRPVRSFGKGKLIRPFLIFPKDELEKLANALGIVYFEDSTNQTNAYFRNRMRHQVIPVLKKENANFLSHIKQFTEQIALANEVIQSVVEPKYEQWVVQNSRSWQIDLNELKKENRSIQVFFFNFFFQKTLIDKGVEINQTHVEQILQILNQDSPQKTINLGKDWLFEKRYNQAVIHQKKKQAIDLANVTYQVNLSEGIFLSETEWLGLEEATKELVLPREIVDWHEEILLIKQQTPLPLAIRHRQNGDRLKLSESLTKKVNRLFIDLKIPNESRETAWVILSAEQEVIWLPTFGNSYLSIPKETDKMFYRIRYRTKR
ncbi:tRNA lysidine(34) synthetase TilS [Enterococcus sp. LJL99]